MLGAYLVFENEAGFSMTPPTARTWARRGRTPVIRVRGRSVAPVPKPASCVHDQLSLENRAAGSIQDAWTERAPINRQTRELKAKMAAKAKARRK